MTHESKGRGAPSNSAVGDGSAPSQGPAYDRRGHSATLVAGGVLGLAPAAQASDAVRFVDITGDGGTVLKADTVDPLYIEHNPSGAQLTFSSSADDPSYVSIPLREQ